MVFSIIMLVCLIVCVGIDYLSLKRIERNGALLGVTLPQNAAELPEVQDIVQRYLRRLRTICLLCAAVSVGLFFAPNSLFYVTVWVYFFFGSLALPYLPCLWGNRALQKLRDAHGWPAAPEDAAWIGSGRNASPRLFFTRGRIWSVVAASVSGMSSSSWERKS